jgi:protein gp37
MAEKTGISWADHTANFWIGCTKVNPACDSCYAQAEQEFKYHRAEWGKGKPRYRTKGAWTDVPNWNRKAVNEGRRKKVFVNSLSDFFDLEVSDEWRNEAIKIMHECQMLDFLLLTKRSSHMKNYFSANIMPPNIWPGVTVENQEFTKRIPNLMSIESHPIKWLSVEPMLEKIDIYDYLTANNGPQWVIVGGESGDKARQFNLEWARHMRDQCRAADVAFFFKQAGENWIDGTREVKTPGNKWDKIEEWPLDLRIQQFPDR